MVRACALCECSRELIKHILEDCGIPGLGTRVYSFTGMALFRQSVARQTCGLLCEVPNRRKKCLVNEFSQIVAIEQLLFQMSDGWNRPKLGKATCIQHFFRLLSRCTSIRLACILCERWNSNDFECAAKLGMALKHGRARKSAELMARRAKANNERGVWGKRIRVALAAGVTRLRSRPGL